MRRLARNVCLVGAVAIAAHGQTFAQTDQDKANSRGVRIIAAPTPPPSSNRVEQPPAAAPATPPALSPAPPQATPDKLVPSASGLAPNTTSVTAAPTDLLPGTASTAPASTPSPSPSPDASSQKPNEPPTLVPSTANSASPNKSFGTGVPTEKLSPAAATSPAAPSPPAEASFETPTKPPLLVPSTIKSAPNESPITTAPSENIAGLPATSTPQTNQEDLEVLASGIKVSNSAGLSVNLIPGSDISVGSRVFFQVSTKRSGYLILIDVDAAGKLTQIYPNPLSVIGPGGVREKSNFIQSGKSFQIPDHGSAYSGFEFVASPPFGTAMVIALLTDRPVQLVDLPNVPSQLVGSVSAVDYLSKLANELRIPGRSASDRLQEAHWSFDVKFYAIK